MAPGAVVVGTSFGARVHVPALRAAGFDVIALVGRDRERTVRRAQRLGVPRPCTVLAEALAIGRVEAVTIATPPDAHAAHVIEACAAGAHVICEKPFALDATEAAAMCAAADGAGVTALVGHEFRWAEDRATVAWALGEGLIGEPRLCSLVQHVPLVADPAARMPDWWFDPARGGGWLGASGSHVVDQTRYWLGEIVSVRARLPVVSDRDGGAEDTFVVHATLAHGCEAVLVQTAASWIPSVAGVTVIAGTRGTLEVVDGEVWLSDRKGRRVVEVPAELRLPPVPARDDPAHRFTHLELGPYTRLCEALRAGVEGRTLPGPVAAPTFADGRACMQVLDAVRASDRAGGERVAVSGPER